MALYAGAIENFPLQTENFAPSKTFHRNKQHAIGVVIPSSNNQHDHIIRDQIRKYEGKELQNLATPLKVKGSAS